MNLEKYNRFDLITSGVVDSVSTCSHSQILYFSVNTSYKGNVTGRIQLTGNDCNSTCGLRLEKGKSYILYALRNEDNTYTLPRCTASHSILTDEEIKAEEEKLENNAAGIQTFSHDLKVWQQEKVVLEQLLKTEG